MSGSPTDSPSSRSLGKTVVAVIILVIAAYLVLSLAIHIALAIAGPLLLILAVVGLIWAWRVLF